MEVCKKEHSIRYAGMLEYRRMRRRSGRYSNSFSANRWVITGARAAMMISRIVPNTWSEKPNRVEIPDNHQNVEYIEWLMMKYPLEDRTGGQWEDRLAQFRQIQNRAEKLRTLQRQATDEKFFRARLLGFQQEGLDFLQKTSGNAILADEMGLGKTVQSLAFVAMSENTLPVLVAAPLVTLPNWKREIERFVKLAESESSGGSDSIPSCKMIRSGKSDDLGNHDFYIINYDLLSKRKDDLAQCGIKTIIMDESQHLRHVNTFKYQAIKELASMDSVNHKIALSGTPIYNHGSELWPVVDIIRPGLLGTWSEFCEYFCWLDYRGRAIVEEGKRDLLREELKEKVLLRRKKMDVLSELKDKIRYKEKVKADVKYYRRQLDWIWQKMEKEKEQAKTAFERTAAYRRAIGSERQAAGIAKMPHVINFVESMMELEEPVAVFCHHRAIHELLHSHLKQYRPVSVVGGQTDRIRQKSIDDFQNGHTNLVIVGLHAGNLGINLTRGHYAVFAELDWSPAIHRQAEDRLHRIGQKDTVFSYYLVGEGTMDDQVASVLVDKGLEIDTILDGQSQGQDEDNNKKAEEILEQVQLNLGKNKNKKL